MCLATLEPVTVTREVGWKVFSQRRSKPTTLFALFRAWQGLEHKVMVDGNTEKLVVDRPVGPPVTYPSGFHVFLRREDAVKWMAKSSLSDSMREVIRRVYFCNVVAQGSQGGEGIPVAVARRMYILSEEESMSSHEEFEVEVCGGCGTERREHQIVFEGDVRVVMPNPETGCADFVAERKVGITV